MDNNKQKSIFHILVSLPHSIGGRLTMSSLLDGLRQNNHKVTVFDELYQSQQDFANLISNNEFDFIAGYDFSALKLKIDNKLNIPCINYFSDVIESAAAGNEHLKYKKYLNQHDSFTFYWDKELCQKAKKEIKNIFYMPHFVNTEVYKPSNKPPQTDIMFAGRLDTDYRLNFWLGLIKSFPEKTFAWFAIQKHFEDALSRLNKHDQSLLQNVYKGFIDNEFEMAAAINNSKIVFNMTSQGKSSFNYRTFQAMSCSKLMLCDYRKEAKTLFNGSEIVFYEDINDAKNKIAYYLANKSEYEKIVKNARTVILKNHDAKNSTANIISITREVMNI